MTICVLLALFIPKMLGIVIGAVIVWAFTDFRFDSFKIPFGGPMIHFGQIGRAHV